MDSVTPEAGCLASSRTATPASLPGEAVNLELVLELQPAPGQVLDAAALVGIRTVLERRLELLNAGGEVRRDRNGQIDIRVGGVDNPRRVADAMAHTILVEIIDPQDRDLSSGTVVSTTRSAPDATGPVASANSVSSSDGSNPIFESIVSGRDFTDVYATRSTYTDAEIIGFTLDVAAATRLEAYTSSHKGQSMSIGLDSRVISSPYINDVISSEGVIEGIPSEEVPGLVAQLKAGALDVPLNLVECHISPITE